MCTKPFSQTKNKGKLFLVAKSSGPLSARMPLKDVRAKNFYNTDFFHTLATVR